MLSSSYFETYLTAISLLEELWHQFRVQCIFKLMNSEIIPTHSENTVVLKVFSDAYIHLITPKLITSQKSNLCREHLRVKSDITAASFSLGLCPRFQRELDNGKLAWQSRSLAHSLPLACTAARRSLAHELFPLDVYQWRISTREIWLGKCCHKQIAEGHAVTCPPFIYWNSIIWEHPEVGEKLVKQWDVNLWTKSHYFYTLSEKY